MNQYPEIEVKNLTKSINSKPILFDINFKLNHKSHLVIIGSSGAGKSMLMKCIQRDFGVIKIQIMVT